jgi:hypothetical protein
LSQAAPLFQHLQHLLAIEVAVGHVAIRPNLPQRHPKAPAESGTRSIEKKWIISTNFEKDLPSSTKSKDVSSGEGAASGKGKQSRTIRQIAL